MGYYTCYSMTVHGLKNSQRLQELTNNMKTTGIIGYALEDSASIENPVYNSCDMVKWYNETNDVVQLSKNFPELTFMVEGDGEDDDDLWREYYHNGKFEYCQSHIVYDKPTYVTWEE